MSDTIVIPPDFRDQSDYAGKTCVSQALTLLAPNFQAFKPGLEPDPDFDL